MKWRLSVILESSWISSVFSQLDKALDRYFLWQSSTNYIELLHNLIMFDEHICLIREVSIWWSMGSLSGYAPLMLWVLQCGVIFLWYYKLKIFFLEIGKKNNFCTRLLKTMWNKEVRKLENNLSTFTFLAEVVHFQIPDFSLRACF